MIAPDELTSNKGPFSAYVTDVFFFPLFAVPDGKPTITAAHNTSDTSIWIEWLPPPKDTIHGEFLGYRITHKIRDLPDDTLKEIMLRDPSATVGSLVICETLFLIFADLLVSQTPTLTTFVFCFIWIGICYQTYETLHSVPSFGASVQPWRIRTFNYCGCHDGRRRWASVIHLWIILTDDANCTDSTFDLIS